MPGKQRSFDHGLRGAREALLPRQNAPMPPEPAEADAPAAYRSVAASAFATDGGPDPHLAARRALLRGRGRQL